MRDGPPAWDNTQNPANRMNRECGPTGAPTVQEGVGVENAADDRAPRPAVESALGDRDAAILAFERQWWRHAGAKEQAIREEFGLSAARYYQLLGALIDSPAALHHDPMLVKRLQRLRDARMTARSTRTLATDD
jgi:hypothetical protein